MAYFTGIVSCHFSIDSELLGGIRDLRVKIDEFRVPLSEVLNRVWTLKHIPDSVIAQHEVLVFLTEKGAPVFFKNSDTPELRSQALNIKTATVQNYAQIEITCLKISAETQRERGAAEEEEELLKSIEEKGGATATMNQQQQTTNPLDLASSNSNNQQNMNSTSAQSTMMNESEEFRRKAALNARRLPLHVSLDGLGDEITNDEERKAATCLLCNMPIRIKSTSTSSSSSLLSSSAAKKKIPAMMMMMGIGQRVKPPASCPNPNSNGRCKKVCCDSCYEFAFNVKMMGMKCPICGGDKNTTKMSPLSSPNKFASAVNTSSVKAMGGNNSNKPGDDGDDLEVIEQDPRKVRRIE